MESKEGWEIGDSNKSSTYILPMLGFKDHQFYHKVNMPQCQFRNCFIGDNIRGIKDKILLLYEFSPTNLFLNFDYKLRKLESFEDSYELDKRHTVYIFKIPDNYKDDYNKIIIGNYSVISQKYKEHIIEFHSFNTESDAFGILYKTSKRRQELEELINGGLPKFYWTKIPPFTELEEPFDETEILQGGSKIKNDNSLTK